MGNLITTMNPPWQTVVGPGVSPGFLFSAQGNLNAGAYLAIGTVVSSNTGQPIIGSNKLVRMRVSTQENVGSLVEFQMSYRTGASTRADIVGALISIATGNYQATMDYNIELPDNVELCCYIKTGSCKNPALVVFLLPS